MEILSSSSNDVEFSIVPPGSGDKSSIVKVLTAQQSLADSLEELPLMFAARVERELSKRKVDDGIRRLSAVQEMLEEYLQKVPELERQQQLDALVAHLGGGQVSNLEQLKAYLTGFSSEVSQQFVALSYARQELSKKTDSKALLGLIDQALLQMLDEQEQAIELGLRIDPMAREAEAQGVGGVQALRDTYRDAVMDYQSLSATWANISKRFGDSALEGVARFMIKALSADLDSLREGVDAVKLKLVLDDMSKLRLLSGLSEQVNKLWLVVVKREDAHGVRAF